MFLGDAGDGPLLDKFAFEGEQRGERVVAYAERLDLSGDAEKLAQEIFNVSGQFDNQLGTVLGGDCFRVGAGIGETRVQARVGGG